MAAATKTQKQKTAKVTPALKEGWKEMKGYGRYAFYKNGKVFNRATGNEIAPSVKTSEGPALQLTDDKGKRNRVTVADVKALFVEQPEAQAAEVKPKKVAQSKKKAEGERGKSKFSYEQAMDIRKRLAAGEKRGALAKELGVDSWTIQSIAIGYSYKLKEGDINPIPEDMMREFLSSNLPSAWKKNPPAGIVLPKSK